MDVCNIKNRSSIFSNQRQAAGFHRWNAFWAIPVFILQLLSPISAQQAYDASTLHNAASRSQTVQQIFYQRWDNMHNNYLHFDAYVNINWVSDFHVNSYNRGTGTTQAIPMRLVRTFSNMFLLLPVYTPQRDDDQSHHPPGQPLHDNAPPNELFDIAQSRKPWQTNSLLAGFSVCGYHYGLTRAVEINRGGAGKETTSDYASIQFFDDIAAVTLIFVPYVTMHAGIIFNQHITPNQDGTLDYNFDMSNISKRYMASFSIFDTFQWRTTAAKDSLESTDIRVNITQLLLLTDTGSAWLPHFSVGYKRFNKYTDADYDPVWVGTVKSDNGSRDSAVVHSYYAAAEKFFQHFIVAAHLQLQHVNRAIIDKRTLKIISLPLVQEWHLKAGYDFIRRPHWDIILYGGISRFYDPGISFHSVRADNWATGWFVKFDINAPYLTFSIKGSYNDSNELRQLVEAVDKYVVEAGASFRI